MRAAASDATMLESRPPLRYAPTGTSAAQVQPDRVAQQRRRSLLEVVLGVVEVELVVDLPVAPRLDSAVRDPQEVAGRQLVDRP